MGLVKEVEEGLKSLTEKKVATKDLKVGDNIVFPKDVMKKNRMEGPDYEVEKVKQVRVDGKPFTKIWFNNDRGRQTNIHLSPDLKVIVK